MTEPIPSETPVKNKQIAPCVKRTGRSKGFAQAFELRQLAFETALQFKGFLPPTDESAKSSARDIASLIRAWAEADEHVRLWLNKPSPGSLRPVAKVKRSVKTRLEPSPIPQENQPTPARISEKPNDFVTEVQPV